MRENAHRPMTLRDIANAAGVSVRGLHYGFKNFAAETPFEHLRKIRLQRAYKELSERPEVAVGDIARKWGFSNSARFAQLFKKSYGSLPSEVRRVHVRGGKG